MRKARHSPKTVLLIGGFASLLALLVGLVGTAQRASARPRPGPADAAPVSPREGPREALHVPEFLPPVATEGLDALATPAAATLASPSSAGEVREERARLVGFVLRPEGEPASRARVVLGQANASCDADGRFELVLPSDVGGADLLAWEPGHEPVLRAAFGASLAASGTSQVRLVLGRETLTLEGAVVTEDGRPLVGWTVELDELDTLAAFGQREPVRTDERGNFLLTDVSDGTHVVRAWKTSQRAAFRSPPAAAGTSGLTIVAIPAD